MIELTVTLIQMSMFAGTAALALYKGLALKKSAKCEEGRREWILLGLFCGEYFLEDLYYVLYWIFYDSDPLFFSSDLAMYMSYLFLILLMNSLSGEKLPRMRWKFSPVLLIPLFTFSMAVFFYLRDGDLIGNIVCFVIMTIAVRLAVDGIINGKGKSSRRRAVYICCLTVIALEYALWISSSLYWPGDTLKNPYFWIDTLFSLSIPCFVPVLGKAVEQ